jgi:hypothetical protein
VCVCEQVLGVVVDDIMTTNEIDSRQKFEKRFLGGLVKLGAIVAQGSDVVDFQILDSNLGVYKSVMITASFRGRVTLFPESIPDCHL